jgi:hypothetical protein
MRAIFFVAMCAWAQVETPRLGMMLDRTDARRPVFGVSASVALGEPEQTGVASMACSNTRCAASVNPAVIAFDGDAVYVYSNGQLTRDQSPVDLNVTGRILSMRVASGSLEFAVRRDQGFWIVRNGDAVVAAIPHATGAVMLLDHAALFVAGRETILRRDDGSELRFNIHARSFVAMSDGYVQIRADASDYALRIERGREKVFLLPEPQ